MTIHALATSRRMTRAFRPDAVDPALVDRFIDAARRAPAAGNTAAAEFLVLEGADVARYWDVTLPAERRAGFPWPQLLLAPVLVLPFVEPDAYVRRYSEPDKSGTGLGVSEGSGRSGGSGVAGYSVAIPVPFMACAQSDARNTLN